MATLTSWVLNHKRLVVGVWIAVTIGAFAAIGPAGDSLSQQFNIPGREGFETNKELTEIYGAGGDVAPIVPVVTLPQGKTVDTPGVREELAAALAKVEAALPESISASFASTGDRAFVSDDGRTTFALVYIPAKGGVDPGLEEASSAQAAVDGVTVGGSPVEVTGLDALRGSVGDIEGAGAGVVLGTLLAALGALLVLAFVFRSFMAFVPLLMAMVAIPTTSGTGSEVSPAAVISVGERKVTLVDYSLVPDMAIVDPMLALTMPREITADTGIDALTHALEAAVSIFASPYTDAFCVQAANLIFASLPRAYREPSDLEARTAMANAATIAGLAFSNAFVGLNQWLFVAVGACPASLLLERVAGIERRCYS